MKITMNRVLAACEAMMPLMEATGLSMRAQLGLVRLWKRLGEERNLYVAAEQKLAREHGTIGDDGRVVFRDELDAGEFARRRTELLCEEVEIEPVEIPDEAALWAASTPKVMMQLEGLLGLVKGEKSE